MISYHTLFPFVIFPFFLLWKYAFSMAQKRSFEQNVNLWLLNIPASFKEKLLTFVILTCPQSHPLVLCDLALNLVLNDLALWTSMTHKIFGVGNLLRMCKKLSLLLFTLHSRYIDKIIHIEILHVQMFSQ